MGVDPLWLSKLYAAGCSPVIIAFASCLQWRSNFAARSSGLLFKLMYLEFCQQDAAVLMTDSVRQKISAAVIDLGVSVLLELALKNFF